MRNNSVDELTLHELQIRLAYALTCFYTLDHYLIEKRIGEWSISHRVALYLESQFPGWNVDCEFNRDGTNPKLADSFQGSKRPDIIVHCRGPEGPNLLAIEVKKSDDVNAEDCRKVERYIEELNYRWAVCVSLDVDTAYTAWFGEGNERTDRAYTYSELQAQFAESAKLEEAIKTNLRGPGYGG